MTATTPKGNELLFGSAVAVRQYYGTAIVSSHPIAGTGTLEFRIPDLGDNHEHLSGFIGETAQVVELILGRNGKGHVPMITCRVGNVFTPITFKQLCSRLDGEELPRFLQPLLTLPDTQLAYFAQPLCACLTTDLLRITSRSLTPTEVHKLCHSIGGEMGARIRKVLAE